MFGYSIKIHIHRHPLFSFAMNIRNGEPPKNDASQPAHSKLLVSCSVVQGVPMKVGALRPEGETNCQPYGWLLIAALPCSIF
jgi:hypothetical protein